MCLCDFGQYPGHHPPRQTRSWGILESRISLPSPINALESQGNHRFLKLLVKAIGVRVRNTHCLLVRGPDFFCGTTLQARIRSVDSGSLHLAKKEWMLGVWLQPEE